MGPSTPESVDPRVVGRLGPEAVRRRCEREIRLWEGKTRPHDGVLVLDRFLPISDMVRIGLKVPGLYSRAHRNYLDVRIVENRVALRNLPAEFGGYRLLQLTDLHCDLDPDLIDVVVAKMAAAQFDQAVLTGDYHDKIGEPYDESLRLMERLIPHLGTAPIGIMGNHDFLGMIPVLEAAGLRLLLNENLPLERDGARLWICGVDDSHSMETHDLRRARQGVPEDACAILLSHSPETWAEAAQLGYALHLSGHTHGGQICLPGGHAIVRKAKVPRRLIAGPWRQNGMAGYTSRGTGGCGVAARLNCPAEITIHILERA